MFRVLVIILLLLLHLPCGTSHRSALAADSSPVLEAILRRHIRVSPGEHPTFIARQVNANGRFDAGRPRPVRAVINGVPVYWANGYAKVDEPDAMLLVTAEPRHEATAMATGEGAAAWAWGGVEPPD